MISNKNYKRGDLVAARIIDKKFNHSVVIAMVIHDVGEESTVNVLFSGGTIPVWRSAVRRM